MKKIKWFIQNQFRKKSRVYIMPTSMGWYLIGLIFLIFLLGVGYSNNLLLGLGLLLSSLALFWLIEAHFWMQNFKFEAIHFADAEASSPMLVKLRGHHPDHKNFLEKLNAVIETSDHQKLPLIESQHTLHALVPKRGNYKADYIKMGSSGFLGLFYSWRFFKLDENFWIYPAKIYSSAQNYLSDTTHENNVAVVRTQGRDYHRLYLNGDDAKRIDWKRLAKSDELFIFIGEEHRGVDDILIQIFTHSPTLETDLSEASYLITHLFQENRPWKLAVNGVLEGPESSETFMIKSLRRLASC
ncbi:MAG: DUF58 domain-containing protein [Bacteriovoracaceae bacterium]